MSDAHSDPRPPACSGAQRDLSSRSDVHDVVVDFYREVVFDDLLAPIFGEVAEVDWADHIPKLIDYWCRVLFGEPGYVGSILGAHERVSSIEPFGDELFERWYSLWTDVVDRAWAGPNAERATSHAARISGVLSRRLTGRSWQPEALTQRHDRGGDSPCWAHTFDDLRNEVST